MLILLAREYTLRYTISRCDSIRYRALCEVDDASIQTVECPYGHHRRTAIVLLRAVGAVGADVCARRRRCRMAVDAQHAADDHLGQRRAARPPAVGRPRRRSQSP